MADRFYDPAKLFSGAVPPIVTLVYPDDPTPFDSSPEWSRVAGELEEQENEKKEEDDHKFFRVDLISSPLSLEPKEDDGEPIRLLFPISDRLIRTDDDPRTRTLLERKMADEVESLYCLHGRDRVIDLGGSLNAAYLAALGAFDDEYADGTREKDEQFDTRSDILAAYEAVHRAWQQQLDALDDRVKEHQKKIAKAAATLADTRLEEAGVEILSETARYFGLQRQHTVNAQKSLETVSDPTALGLVGADYSELLEAVERIRSRIEAVDHPAPAKRERFAQLNSLRTSPAEDAAYALQLELSQACQRFPVLHLTWKTLRFARHADALRVVYGALSNAWAANRRIRQRIATDPDVVWLFPPLVHEALDQLAREDPECGDLEVGARAAEDLVESSATRVTQQLAQIVGFLDFAVGLCSPAPPVAMVFAVASLVTSVVDQVLEYEQLSAQSDGALSALDPDKALSSAPDADFFILGIVFSLLDLKSVRSAYQAARVTREVDELVKLVPPGPE